MNPVVNTYTCNNKHVTVTIDRVEGTTSMLISCPMCEQLAGSAWYRCDQNLEPEYEWYKPDDLKGLLPSEKEHVSKGGLLLRKIIKPVTNES